MKFHKIEIDENSINKIADDFEIKEMYLFGSILRDDFNEKSDVDILVTFKNNTSYSLFELFELKEKLKMIFNRSVDLIEKKSLKNPYRKAEILKTARRIYAT